MAPKQIGRLHRLTKEFESHREELIAAFKALVPGQTDLSVNNPAVAILEQVASVADQLHFYLDRRLNDAFLLTASDRGVTILRALEYGYLPHPAAGAHAVASVTRTALNSGGSIILRNNLTFRASAPPGALSSSVSSDVFFRARLDEPLVIDPVIGETVSFNVIEGTSIGAATPFGIPIGKSDGTPFQVFEIPHDNVLVTPNDIRVYVNGVEWNRIDSVFESDSSAQNFLALVNKDNRVQILFGDGLLGAIPVSGANISAKYFVSAGTSGNIQGGGGLLYNDILTELTARLLPAESTDLNFVLSTNPVGGEGPEDIDAIRFRAPINLRALHRAVTKSDYVALALSYPGVGKAAVLFNCGKFVYVYVVPESGPASDADTLALRSAVKDFLDERRMITTQVQVLNPITISLEIVVSIYVSRGFNASEVDLRVKDNLERFFSSDNQEIGQDLHPSDISSIIENTEGVSYSYVESVTHDIRIINQFSDSDPRGGELDPADISISASNPSVRFFVYFLTPTEYELYQADIYPNVYVGSGTVNVVETFTGIFDSFKVSYTSGGPFKQRDTIVIRLPFPEFRETLTIFADEFPALGSLTINTNIAEL